MTQTNKGYQSHLYGDNHNILEDSFLTTQLAQLSIEKTKQPDINRLISSLFTHLIKEVINQEFPTKQDTVMTRMGSMGDQRGYWTGKLLDKETKVVLVDLARAGTLPCEVCFQTFNTILNPDLVRQDHIFIARESDASGKVTGVNWSGSKIGGDIDNAIVVIPDPMGATGTSISEVINYYKENVQGKVKKFITLNLIQTPNFILRMQKDHPEAITYGLRLDRAASSEKALEATPGTFPQEESGLNDQDYIIPGAGGLGELMNNSFC